MSPISPALSIIARTESLEEMSTSMGSALKPASPRVLHTASALASLLSPTTILMP